MNSGPVVVGSVGGGGRLEFAVIGDPVNVAARVEHLTRETGDIDPDHRGDSLPTVRGRTIDAKLDTRGEFALKGVSEPVPIYAIPTESGRKFESGAKNPSSCGV